MSSARLPIQSRSRSVVLLLGVVIGLLVAGLAIPFLFGERLRATSSAAPADELTVLPESSPGSTSAPGAVPGASGGPTTPGPGGAIGTTTGSGTTGTTGAGGSTGSSGSSGTTGGSTTGQQPAPGELTATDRGVTATTVKVGFTALDTAGLSRVGVGIGVTVEQQRDAWIGYAKEINARGGLSGRKIEPVVVSYDPTNENSQRQACAKLTQDEKVFAIVGGFNYPVAVSCVVRENQTPLFSGYPATSDEIFATAGGRFITMYPRASRMMATQVAALDQVGKLKGRTIGILNQVSNDPGAKTSTALQQAIEARGYQVKRKADLSADSGTAASQVPITVNQFQQDGIDTVFVLAGVITATQFVQQGDRQGYTPNFHMSDWANNNNDFVVQNMPASFDGEVGVTHTVGHGNKMPFGPESAMAARCRQNHDQHSGRTLAARGTAEYGATMQNCDSILTFEKAARAAGPNLTRASISATVPGLGSYPIANWGPGSFGSGKYDFTDQVRLHVFRASCSCWQPQGGFFRPG